MAQRRCLFCGRETELSREHALPDWLTKSGIVSFDARTAHTYIDPRTGVDATRSYVPVPVGQRVIRRVCRDCNQGWMSQLEDATKPVLTPLILGERRDLSGSDVATLALWIAKTAATTQFVAAQDGRRTGRIPPRHVREIYERKRPAPETQVFIAQASESEGVAVIPDHLGLNVHLPVGKGPPFGVRQGTVLLYATTFWLERALLQIVGVSDRTLVSGRWFPEDPEGVHRIWPKPTALSVPFEQTLGFERLAHLTFGRLMGLRQALQAGPSTGKNAY